MDLIFHYILKLLKTKFFYHIFKLLGFKNRLRGNIRDLITFSPNIIYKNFYTFCKIKNRWSITFSKIILIKENIRFINKQYSFVLFRRFFRRFFKINEINEFIENTLRFRISRIFDTFLNLLTKSFLLILI